jgi:ABC-2 type transport system permease protein
MIIAAVGFLLFVLVIGWVFGREFVDGALKDMLAVPVPRSSILLAMFITVAIWSATLSVVIVFAGMVMGVLVGLPGGSIPVFFQGSIMVLITTGLVILTLPPFAFFASVGRGYLLPIGIAVLTLMMTTLVMIAGWAEYIPWVIPGLYAQGKDPLPNVSYWIVLFTGLLGRLVTYLWWKYADQSH